MVYTSQIETMGLSFTLCMEAIELSYTLYTLYI